MSWLQTISNMVTAHPAVVVAVVTLVFLAAELFDARRKRKDRR